MSAYMVACAIAAPALLITVIALSGWLVVLLYRQTNQRIDQLIQQAVEPPFPLGSACQLTRQCFLRCQDRTAAP